MFGDIRNLDGEKIDYHDLPLTFEEAGRDDQAVAPGAMPLNERLDEIEREMIAQAMQETNHVKTKAASLLGIKTSALYYKLDKYGLE